MWQVILAHYLRQRVWSSPTTIDNVLVQDCYMLIGSNATPGEKKAPWAVPRHGLLATASMTEDGKEHCWTAGELNCALNLK